MNHQTAGAFVSIIVFVVVVVDTVIFEIIINFVGIGGIIKVYNGYNIINGVIAISNLAEATCSNYLLNICHGMLLLFYVFIYAFFFCMFNINLNQSINSFYTALLHFYGPAM